MKRNVCRLCILGLMSVAVPGQELLKTPVEYVAPNIGGIGQLLTATIPYVQLPHGMARLAPITTPGITDRYLAETIYGFPAGAGVITALTGPLNGPSIDAPSTYDHDFEIATPYYYKVPLDT